MTDEPKSAIALRVPIFIAVFLSGAAGLAYEISWSRLLVPVLGNSADATALILAAFMVGMALGARLFGGFADRVHSPLRLYAKVEIGLGIVAFAIPLVIRWLGTSSLMVGPGLSAARLISAFVLIVFPSMMMGATLPVLVRGLNRWGGSAGGTIGLVYGLNTLGAAGGASLTGFVAIPAYGLGLTSVFAALGSISAGILVFATARLLKQTSSAPADNARAFGSEAASESALQVSSRLAGAALLAVFISGFVMLAAEVLWSRVLTFVFGHDTYAFAILLAVVLIGLGLGGILYRAFAGRAPVATMVATLGLLGLAVVNMYWVSSALVIELGRNPFDIGASSGTVPILWLEFFRELSFTPLLVLLPAILAGAAFPAACAVYVLAGSGTGRRVGTATLLNGAGSALGALTASFLFVQLLGIQGAFLALGLITAVSSATLAIAYRKEMPKRFIALIAPAVITVVLLIVMPSALPRAMLLEAVGKNHQELLYYEEGRTGTVSVTANKINGEKQLFMNAVNEVTTRLVHDQSFKLLGHLGPLLHPRPREGLMICLGAGLSVGAALTHPFISLDVVELSEAIPHAAAMWKEENNNALEDPRLKLHLGDGRHFLAGTTKLYDVIAVDSTHPKAVDSWILYTEEFYRRVRARLTEDGIAVQWLPLHGLSEREFKIIVRTFQSVFPETTLWVNAGFEVYGHASYVKLVGTLEPLLIDYKEFSLRLKEPRIARDLAPFGMDAPEELLDSFLASPAAVASWVKGLPVQTDNRPLVPYTTAYSSGRRMAAPLLLSVRTPVTPLLRRLGQDELETRKRLDTAYEAQGFLLAGMLDRAFEVWPAGKKIKLFRRRSAEGPGYYRALAGRYEDNVDKLFEIGSYLGNLGAFEDALKVYDAARQLARDDTRIEINRGLVLFDLDKLEAAREVFDKALGREPNNALIHYNLGTVLNEIGDPSGALQHFERATRLDPNLLGARLALAESELDQGKLKEAENELRDVIEHNPWVAEAWDLLGLVAQARRDWQLAKKHHIHALTLEPYRGAAHYNLGIALAELGQHTAAAKAYLAALAIDPKDARARNNLGLEYAAAGLFERAAEEHRQALEIDPLYAEAAYNLGLAYKALGNTVAAAEAFGLSLKIAPELLAAEQRLRELGISGVEFREVPEKKELEN